MSGQLASSSTALTEDRSSGPHDARRSRPRWLAPVSVLGALAGLAVSGYLSYEHFTGNTTLACSVGGLVDCAKVTSSPWSSVLGVPVALLGLLFFAVALALSLPPVWRRHDRWLDPARLAWMSVGLTMVLYLVWAELYRIHAICLWCTAVHVLTFVLWAAVLFGQILSGPPTPDGGEARVNRGG